MKTPRAIYFFPNGCTAVFDANGQQIGELQEAWFRIFINFLKEKGITGEEIEKMEIKMPDGRMTKYIAKYDNWD